MIIWNTPAGDLGVINERELQNISIRATSTVGPITFELISGSFPRGLRLSSLSNVVGSETRGTITGSAGEVKRFTTSRFVIRASDGIDLEDRTFSLSVDGSDIPEWLTREGFLNVGPAKAYFVLDNSEVNFQLEATDTDLTIGDTLEFFLVPQGGELPPGLTLSSSGLISGFTDPIFALEYNGILSGGYDTAPLDVIPLDFVESRSNGFDSYFYDNVTYDYNEPSRVPRRISRIYNFVVSISDGINSVNRLFKIYVVTEEFLQADNSIVQVDTNLFQADSASDRNPLWITESNLGRFRANNYVTIFLDVYDPPSLSGTITYFLQPTNAGTYQLRSTGEIITSGQYELSNKLPEFKYVFKGIWNSATSYSVGDAVFYLEGGTYTIEGDWDADVNYNINDAVYYKNNLWVSIRTSLNKNPISFPVYWRKIPVVTWVCQIANTNKIPTTENFWNTNVNTSKFTFVAENPVSWISIIPETVSELPPGMFLDSITGEIAGRVPYQSAVTKTYQFTMTAVNFPASLATTTYTLVGDWNAFVGYQVNDAVRYLGFIYICTQAHRNVVPEDGIDEWYRGVATADKTFTVEIVGEIESSVAWLTESDRGTIKPNQPSQIYIAAESRLYGGRIGYDFVSGSLPPGLIFLPTGDIEGKVRQFADSDGPGLTRYYDQDSSFIDSTGSRTYNTIFDGGETTFDKRFTFTIKARDAANFAESLRTFYITVISDNTKTYANLYVKAFQSKEKRLEWYNFITNATIFQPSEIYRYGDSNFGIQTDLKVLVYAGIESREAVKYVQAMSRNHYRKRLLFGDLKIAEGKDPITQETIYEIIYVDIIDDLEKNGKSISQTVNLSDTIKSKVLISYDSINVSSNIPFASDSDHQRIFPNSFKNMRNQIKTVGDRDREFLPLWMRSIQENTAFESGFVKALPLCFVKPGKGQNILARIKAENFDFKSIDFVADRYIIDILDGEIEDKYLAFPQRGEKLP
jgi:hypothetical protein